MANTLVRFDPFSDISRFDPFGGFDDISNFQISANHLTYVNGHPYGGFRICNA